MLRVDEAESNVKKKKYNIYTKYPLYGVDRKNKFYITPHPSLALLVTPSPTGEGKKTSFLHKKQIYSN